MCGDSGLMHCSEILYRIYQNSIVHCCCMACH
jgi:hypothetical protein